MVVVYPIGFPSVLGWWLFRHRHALSSQDREQKPELRSCFIMWEPYKPDKYFYEVGKEFPKVKRALERGWVWDCFFAVQQF